MCVHAQRMHSENTSGNKVQKAPDKTETEDDEIYTLNKQIEYMHNKPIGLFRTIHPSLDIIIFEMCLVLQRICFGYRCIFKK